MHVHANAINRSLSVNTVKMQWRDWNAWDRGHR